MTLDGAIISASFDEALETVSFILFFSFVSFLFCEFHFFSFLFVDFACH